jgi:hypothetical protein
MQFFCNLFIFRKQQETGWLVIAGIFLVQMEPTAICSNGILKTASIKKVRHRIALGPNSFCG